MRKPVSTSQRALEGVSLAIPQGMFGRLAKGKETASPLNAAFDIG